MYVTLTSERVDHDYSAISSGRDRRLPSDGRQIKSGTSSGHGVASL